VSVDRILDHLADIVQSVRGLLAELDAHSHRPVSGRILISGVESMTQPTPIDIPDNDVPCSVVWKDRLGGVDANEPTTWSTEGETGIDASALVTVVPDAADSEKGTVTFHAPAGVFRVVATTPSGTTVARAQSALYNITPGAPAVGEITVQ
jgi:hypothetical protein